MGIRVAGHGAAVGDLIVKNTDCDAQLGLKHGWLEKHTGIKTRRISSPTQSALTMAEDAVGNACRSANIDIRTIASETALLHIHNGMSKLTPPAVVQLAAQLQLDQVRTIGIDGVCAEPIAALELADMLIASEKCVRAIISASVDFTDFVDSQDRDTAGLFGAGAGAIVVERASEPGSLRSLAWETYPRYARAGEISVLGVCREPDRVVIDASYYQMDGKQLAKVALRVVPNLVLEVLRKADWGIDDIDVVISHQPNAKLLEAAVRKFGLSPDVMVMPVREFGNMGPASLLVALSQAYDLGRIDSGTNALLVAFGLGFSCGAAALEF